MEIFNLFPGSYASNCYVLISQDESEKNRAAVIDPSADADDIIDFISSKDASLEYIIMTHGHFDHIISLDSLREKTKAPALIHKNDSEMLSDGRKNAYSLFFGGEKTYKPADRMLEDGDVIDLGKESLTVISAPGHSKGSICLLTKDALFTGDTLFADAAGRCDLYGGSVFELFMSHDKLKKYGNIKIYPGHGSSAMLLDALASLRRF